MTHFPAEDIQNRPELLGKERNFILHLKKPSGTEHFQDLPFPSPSPFPRPVRPALAMMMERRRREQAELSRTNTFVSLDAVPPLKHAPFPTPGTRPSPRRRMGTLPPREGRDTAHAMRCL